MKILLFQWKAYSGVLLEKKLKEMGHDVCTWRNDGVLYNEGSTIEELVVKLREGYDIVFSYNYFRNIAEACNKVSVIYVSWMQDSPMLSLYDVSSGYETNRFFCFDSEQFSNLQKRGLPHVYYLPLGVDKKLFEETADNTSKEEQRKYQADVSFVGSLYAGNDIYGDVEEQLAPFVRGYLAAFCQTQLAIPAVRFSEMSINADCYRILKDQMRFPDHEIYDLSFDELMDNLIDRHVTVLERREMLRTCQDIPNFKLYTNTDTPDFPQIINCGKVDYYTQMPKVFRYSKINLNLSLRSIRCGIPLRVLDVIASGGFVLTNAQPDLFLFFEEGKNIATFQSLAEMREKIAYYLSHEEERKEIIRAGQEVIDKQFDFSIQLHRIFEKITKKITKNKYFA